MENIKNIAVGKIGKSVKFDNSKWSAIGGDNEAPTLFITIARKNPDLNFYMIGKSDLRLLKPDVKKGLNLPSNLIDVWEGFNSKVDNETTFVTNKLKKLNIKLDCGVFYNGPASYASIPNMLKKKGSDDFYSILDVFRKYVGPVAHYLNDSGIPYFTLGPDPRYIPTGARDLFNREQFVLSQYDTNVSIKHMPSQNEQELIETIIPVQYSGLEKVFYLGREKRDITTIPKNKKMLIVLNEGGNGGLKRGPLLKEYILDYIDDIEIYGKWSDEWYEDSRFKGPKDFMQLHSLLESVKYTFIIPIQKGWVTSKFWEMINFGIIPFMHPYYDQQHHIPCPDFIRVNSPEELKEKIDFLENNPNEYKKLLSELNDMLKEEYYNGDFVNEMVMSGIKKLK